MGPLEGIKVLDLTAMVSGPVATMILADQGAEVIKVEPPGGEQMRRMGFGESSVRKLNPKIIFVSISGFGEQGTMDLIFETRDGFITAGAVSGKEWQGMCLALNREELIEDEMFATSRARMQNADLRKQIVADEVKNRHSAEILKRLDDNDVPNAPLLSRTAGKCCWDWVTNKRSVMSF
jgi:crotonobetainyl-CoA:carnitine CoA-transferase CaiB-like acyl-CoA transferase